MYVMDSSGKVVTPEVRHSVLMLTKVLFRFEIINEEQALSMVTKFRILFV